MAMNILGLIQTILGKFEVVFDVGMIMLHF